MNYLKIILAKLREWQKRRYIEKLRRLEQRILIEDRREREKIARLFNLRYCIATRYDTTDNSDVDGPPGTFGFPVKKGNRWMCPVCNRIHEPIKHSLFIGLIYPECCGLRESSRHDNFPEKGTLKRPIGMYGPEGLFIKLRRENLQVSEPIDCS